MNVTTTVEPAHALRMLEVLLRREGETLMMGSLGGGVIGAVRSVTFLPGGVIIHEIVGGPPFP